MPLIDQDGNVVQPTTGNDDLVLIGDNQTIDLLAGDDILEISGGTGNTVNGNEGDDLIDSIDGGGNNTLNGDRGSDQFFVGSNDTANGGTGRDIIYFVEGGNNTFDGGTGRDRFVIAAQQLPDLPEGTLPESANTIQNFQTDLDVVTISFSGVTQISDLDITEENGNTVISIDGTEDGQDNPTPVAIIEGVARADFPDEAIEILPEGTTEFPVLPNSAPEVTPGQTFKFTANTPEGAILGQVEATDVDEDEIVQYEITGGNDAGAFAIDAGTGVITVADAGALPTAPTDLTVVVTDAEDAASAAGTITIEETALLVRDVPPPEGGLSIEEGSAVGTAPIPETVIVEYIAADKTLADLTITIENNPDLNPDDPDNLGPAFAIDVTEGDTEGQLIVVDPSDLVFSETNPEDNQFTLTITATDTQDNTITDSGDVLMNITPPDGEFSLDVDDNRDVATGDPVFDTNDGLLALRFLIFQDTGGLNDNLITGLVGENSRLDTPDELNQYLNANLDFLNVDGNVNDAGNDIIDTNDGLLALRFLIFQDTGGLNDNLITGLIGETATRTTPDALNTYLSDFLVPNNFEPVVV